MSLRAHSIEVKSVREQMRPIVTTMSSPVPSLLPPPNLVRDIVKHYKYYDTNNKHNSNNK